MALPLTAAKFALLLLIYPALIGSLVSILLWTWERLKKRPVKEPALLEASALVAFFVGGALSALPPEGRYSLVQVALPWFPFLSFRLDAATSAMSVGAGAIGAFGLALGERGPLWASLRLGLLSIVGFCSTSTYLPLLGAALIVASLMAVAASLGGGSDWRPVALRLFVASLGLALVGGAMRLPLAWCEEGDILNLSNLTGYMPLWAVLRLLVVLSIGLPLAFVLPLGGKASWAVGLLTLAAGGAIGRFCSLALPEGAGASSVLFPVLSLGAFSLSWLAISAVERKPFWEGLSRGALLLGLLCLLHGEPHISSAGLLLLASAGLALSASVSGNGWMRFLHRVAIASLPPFVTSTAFWLALSSLWGRGGERWLLLFAGIAWALGAAGAFLAQPEKPARTRKGDLLLLLVLLLSSPLPLLVAPYITEALAPFLWR